MTSAVTISPEDKTQACQLLALAARCLDAEAVGLDNTYDDRHALTSNRLRGIVNDLLRLAVLLNFQDVQATIEDLRETWDYQAFQVDGTPITDEDEDQNS